jgi:hypothetical protein
MRLFNEIILSDLLRSRLEQARRAIMSMPSDELLGTDDGALLGMLVPRYEVAPITFQWDQVEVTHREEATPANRLPGFGGYPGERVNLQIVLFHIPYEGDFDVLRAQPSSRILWSTDVTHYSAPRKEIVLEVPNVYNDGKRVRSVADDTMGKIRTQVGNVNRDISAFNADLPRAITELARIRRDELRRHAGTLDSIGFPVRRKS